MKAYSYGYSNIRDAATITPRSEVQPLVIPDDIMRLPSLRGFLVFPEGFDAARIKLTYKDWPKVAEGYVLRENVEPLEFIAMPKDEGEEAETGGRDRSADPELEPRGDDLARDPAIPLSPALEPGALVPENVPDGPVPDPTVGKQMAFRLEQAPQGERTNGREQDPTQRAERMALRRARRSAPGWRGNWAIPALPDKEAARRREGLQGHRGPLPFPRRWTGSSRPCTRSHPSGRRAAQPTTSPTTTTTRPMNTRKQGSGAARVRAHSG